MTDKPQIKVTSLGELLSKVEALESQLAAAQAENARMRSALEELSNEDNYGMTYIFYEPSTSFKPSADSATTPWAFAASALLPADAQTEEQP